MRALGFDVKKTDVLKVLRDYDREGTGKITFEDFNEVSKYMLYMNIDPSKYEPPCEKTNNLHMRKQRCRSASW